MYSSKNRSRKESRAALIASMPVDENGDVPEDFLRRRNNLRSARSRAADGRSTAKKVYPRNMPPEQAVSWVMDPGRYDVEGIDCDGKANVPRRGTNTAKPKAPTGKTSKPKAPAKKPAKPKAKAPAGKTSKPKAPTGTTAKPKAPKKPAAPKKPKAPATDSGLAVSGSEIVEVAKFIDKADCRNLGLGNGQFSMEFAASDLKSDYGIGLSRRDGRGMFGLDNDAVWGFCAYELYNIVDLDPNSMYAVSLEGENLVFRTGADFSDVELKVGAYRVERPMTFGWMTNGFAPPEMVDFDVIQLRRALGRMDKAGVMYCKLESSAKGVTVSPSRGDSVKGVVIASSMGGRTKWSNYTVRGLYKFVKILAPYATSIGFCPDGPLVLKGEVAGYEITAVFKGAWI